MQLTEVSCNNCFVLPSFIYLLMFIYWFLPCTIFSHNLATTTIIHSQNFYTNIAKTKKNSVKNNIISIKFFYTLCSYKKMVQVLRMGMKNGDEAPPGDRKRLLKGTRTHRSQTETKSNFWPVLKILFLR